MHMMSMSASPSFSTPGPLHTDAAAALLAVASQLQNPELYAPGFNVAQVQGHDRVQKQWKRQGGGSGSGSGSGLVASRAAKAGEILSLYPVHGVGLGRLGAGGRDVFLYDSKRDEHFSKRQSDSRRS